MCGYMNRIDSTRSVCAPRSVNLKFIPEAVFVSKPFSSLLLLHLTALFLFAAYKWCW